MPRGPRLDYPGALHHLIGRGIERGALFRTAYDRTVFLDRLAALVRSSQAGSYAWALMPDRAHVLLRTGTMLLSRLAPRWLGFYTGAFNRTHRRVVRVPERSSGGPGAHGGPCRCQQLHVLREPDGKVQICINAPWPGERSEPGAARSCPHGNARRTQRLMTW